MKHVRYGAVLVALGVMVVFSTGCPLTTFYVTYPTNSQHYTVNAGNQLVMTVRFSRDVDFSSLVAGANVVLDTDTTANATITIAAGSAANEIVITTTDTVANLLTFQPDGFFKLNIAGDGVRPVEDTSGEALDGDKDNVAGGNFSHQYIMLG
ncbi:MAG: hypothetical protein GWP08_14305 [Nitrospiraceae bacterium]|nr:hypothetical protein [Nitrospiraceae bacterium]